MARDLTIEVLKQIRDEVVGLRGELRETRTALSERIDQTNEKVDALARLQTATEIRRATELITVSHAVTSVRETIREKLDDRQRVDDHERRLGALERKAG